MLYSMILTWIRMVMFIKMVFKKDVMKIINYNETGGQATPAPEEKWVPLYFSLFKFFT